MSDGITIPDDAVNVNVSPAGVVSAVMPDNTIQELGEIELHTFVNRAGLKSIGGNIYIETDISGPAIEGTPGEGGR